MASAEITLLVKRDGLVLSMWTKSNKLIGTLDLQETLKLSDEHAKELLARLDEREKHREAERN